MSKMILIIEDEESIQNIIKAFLEDAGYTVVLAADGLEGLTTDSVQKKEGAYEQQHRHISVRPMETADRSVVGLSGKGR